MDTFERVAINDTPNTRLLSFRIPRGDIRKLNEQAKRLGVSKTEIVVTGMRLALDNLQTETAAAVPMK